MTITRRSAKLSRVLIVALAIALVLTAVPAVIFGSSQKSYAAAANVSTEAQLKEALQSASVTDITVTADIQVWSTHDFTNDGGNLTMDNVAAFTIPAGQTKNLKMGGHKIYAYYHSDGDDCHLLICEQKSSAFDAAYENGGVHYVMFENFGTLNITGGGEIDTHLAQYGIDSYEQESSQYSAGAVATVKNHGELNVASGTSINISKFGYEVEDNNSKAQSVAGFGAAIYSDAGAVNFAGNINVSMDMQGTPTGYVFGREGAQTKSMAYGIYSRGGVVNVSGGSINVSNYAALNGTNNEPDNSCSVAAATIGIFTVSSLSTIDNVSITTSVKYEDDDDSDDSGNNCDYSYIESYGVAYTDSAPTICTGTQIEPPKINRGNWASSDGDAVESKVAVTQLTGNPVSLFDVTSSGQFDQKSQRMSESSGVYWFKDENGCTWTCGYGDGLTYAIPNSLKSSTAKILVIYRYYNTSNQLEAAFTAPAEYGALSNAINLSDVSSNHCTAGQFTYTGGGSAKNTYFYDLTSIRYWSVGTAQLNWKTANPTSYILKKNANDELESVNSGRVDVAAGNTIYIYVDYIVYPADPVRFNVNNASMTSAENTAAEVYYTGSAAQFGSGANQINLHVYKTNYTKDRYLNGDELFTNDEEITSRFQTIGTGSTAFSISVKNADGSNAGTALPTNPGVYTVTVSTGAETTYNASPSVAKNFAAGTFTFTLTIKPREVTITQTAVPEITYGAQLSSLTSAVLANYLTVDTGVAGLTPNSTFTWQSPSAILDAGDYDTLVLTWSAGTNYVDQTLDNVRVKVNKANLSITAKNKTVTYGTDINLTSDDFTFAGLANKANEEQNVFNEIKDTLRVDGSYWSNTGFSAAETHSYGLTANSTSNYIITNTNAVLTINRSGLIITIPLVEKKYDAKTTIDIEFTSDMIVGGLVDTYGTAGLYIDTYTDAPLANGGAVGDTTASVQIARFSDLLKGPKAMNYTVASVTNATSIPARVSKADPIVDPLALASSAITYDPTKTLSQFSEITGNTTTGEILVIGAGTGKTPGKWIWKSDVKPTVAQSAYVAQFVPNDSNYATVDQTMTINVAKRTITVGVSMPTISYGDPQPSGTYTFSGFPDGSTEKINVSGSSYTSVNFELSGNVYYSCIYDNEAAAVQNRAAGTYAITITNALEADNYTFVADTTSVLTVNPKTLTLTPVQKNLVYGDVIQSSDLSYNVVGLVEGDEAVTAGINVSYSHSYTSSSPIGSYPVTMTVSNQGDYPNYSFVLNSGMIVVSKATLTVIANDITVVYGTAVPTYTYDIVGYKGSDTSAVVHGTPSFSSTYSATSNAGNTYQIIVGVNDLFADNYNFVASAETALITVTPAPVIVTEWPSYTVENGKTLADAVKVSDGAAETAATHVAIAGSFRFNNTDSILPYNAYSIAQNVTATFYPNNTNYQSVVGEIEVTVLAKNISGTPSISGTIMAGQTVRLDVSTLDPSSIDNYRTGSIKWYVDDLLRATGSQTFVIEAGDVGKDLKVEITADESRGYRGTATYRSPSPISEVLEIPTLNDLYLPTSYEDVTQNTATFTYDKQSHSLSVSRKNPNIGQVTVKYNGKTTAVDAGTYTVTVDIASSATGIYAPVTGLVVGYLTIEPRPITVTFTADDKEYDGKNTASIKNFDATNGIISTDNVSVNREQATFTFATANAGDGIPVTMNYAYLEGAARANYVIAQEPIFASITPKEISSAAIAADQDYDVSNYTVQEISFASPAGILAADKSGVTIGTTTGIVGNNAAGLQYVTYIDYENVLTGEKAGNYSFTASNASVLQVRIRQVQDPNKTTPTVISTSYSSAQTLASLSGDLPSGWAWDDASIIPTVRVKTYSATYTPENSSYLTEKMSVRVDVSPVEVTITPATAYLTYGDPVPSLGYTVIGFTGSDSIANCAGQVIIKTNYTKGSGVDATYTVYASESTIANPNYTFKKNVTGTIYVSPRTYVVTPTAESRPYEAGNNNVTVTFVGEGALEGDGIGLSFTSTQGTVSNNNVGSQVVSFTAPTLTGAKAGNYTVSVQHIGNLRVAITKATPVVSFPTEASVEYGQKYSAATFKNDANSSINGTFALVDGNNIANEVHDAYMLARFVPSDTGNYESVTGYVLVRVGKAQLNMSVSFSGTLYSGQTLTAVISGASADALDHVTYAWYRVNDDGAKIFVSDERTYELTDDDIGYRICLEVLPDPSSNYELSDEAQENGSFSTTSLKAVVEESLTFWQKFMKWWYKILAAIQAIFDVRR